MKYIYLISVIICIILYYIYNKFKEHYDSYDIENKIELKNWWANNDENSINVFKNILKNIDISKFNKIYIYSVFGNNDIIKEPNNLYIQFSGENYLSNADKFDINIGPIKTYNNNITFLYGFYNMLWSNINMDYFTSKRKLNNLKDNFCLFSVSNSGCEKRNNFFQKLSKYKFVHSCGKLFNNMQCPDGFQNKDYINFISNFKFMICFENSSVDYYFTEKCVNAFLGGAIPIYWGCPQTSEFINLDSILYLPPNYTEEDENNLIQTIIELDNNDELYRQKYEQVFFNIINNKLPDMFDINFIINNIKNVLE